MKYIKYDLIIIGGGPIGIFGSYYANHRGLKVALVEKNENLGGMPFYIYPTKKIYDIPGLINISGGKLISTLLKQLKHKNNDISIITNTYPKNIKKEKDYFKVSLSNGNYISSKCILFSQGNGQAEPKKLDKEIVKNGCVKYTVKNINLFKNKTILISGGGDSALDYAFLISMMNKNKKVYLIHRRDNFRGFIDKINKINNRKNIIIKKPCEIKKIVKKNLLSKVILQTKNGEEEILCDIVLIQHGFSFVHNKIELSNISLKVDNGKYKVNNYYESSIEQLYIIGSLNNKTLFNLISPFMSNITIAICHMINKYFDKRSTLY